jgi:hypothetical protein
MPDPSLPAPTSAPTHAPGPPLDLSIPERERLVEALRLGVIPAGHVQWYTVGRDEVLAAVRRDLDATATRGQMRILVGDYGTGKSHLLEWIREEALARGFLVGSVALDDREVTCAHPKRIYRRLVADMAYPERTGSGIGSGSPHRAGLAPLLDELLATGEFPRDGGRPDFHPYLDAALHKLAAARAKKLYDQEELVIEWIEGHPSAESETTNHILRALRGPRLPAMPDYRTFGHVYGYLLGGLACVARRAGYSGLVLLLDEAEFFQTLSKANQAFARHVLACLALASRGANRVCFEAAALVKGGQAAHRKFPFVSSEDQPLYTVVCLTPVEQIRAILGALVPFEQVSVELAPLAPADYQELFRRLTAAYPVPERQRALLDALAEPMGKALFAGVQVDALRNPRAVMKLIVEFLDVLRHVPERAMRFVDDLMTGLFPGAS